MARDSLIKIRRGSAATWTGVNPTLAAGEFGWESDTNKLKIGDGTTSWNSLAYLVDASGSGIQFDTSPQVGGFLDITTDDVDGDGYGVHVHDTDAGSAGVFIESGSGDVGMVAGNAAYIKSGDSSVEAAATAVRVDLDTGATFTIYDSDGSTVLAEWTAS